MVDVRVNKIETSSNLIDESLARLRGIPKPKHHIGRFGRSKQCYYCHLFNIFRCDRDLVVSANEVNF